MNLGQLMLFGFEGTKATPELKAFLRETGLGGVILFKRNVENPRQLKRLIAELQDAAERPLIVAIDQEGGRVARLAEPFTKLPPMARLGAAAESDDDLAFQVGRVLGRELAAIGVNTDFAPVLDVATNPSNPVIGDRALSPDAGLVARLGCEIIRGLQGEGVAACGKHFPGHGDTDVDSHRGLPVLNHTRARFDACELGPFRAAVGTAVASIMTAHLLAPNLDRDAPATISRAITTGILRRELGFDGLVFTDCLTMEGIAAMHPVGESAWRAISAGADVAVVCHDRAKQSAALEGVRRAAGEGRIDERRIEEALARVARFKERYCKPEAGGRKPPPLSVIGCREHRAIAARIA